MWMISLIWLAPSGLSSSSSKSLRDKDSNRVGSRLRTVLFRGALFSRAISPKTSPAESVATMDIRPDSSSLQTSTLPLWITNMQSPGSRSRMMVWSGATLIGFIEAWICRVRSSESCENRRVPLRNLTVASASSPRDAALRVRRPSAGKRIGAAMRKTPRPINQTK